MPVLVIALGMPIVAVMPFGLPAAALVAAVTLALAMGLAAWWAPRARVRHTTLRSAWWWTLAAILAWAGAELLAVAVSYGWISASVAPLRVAAIALSFCPIVSVLGAKRPQHRAWNYVVLALYAIVALPAAEGLFLHPAHRVEMGDARGWFLWILILLGPINYLPTRHWLAALVLAAGQIVALSPFLALIRLPLLPHAEVVGFWLAVFAVVAVLFATTRRFPAANSYDRQWLDFRDAFGMLWALRVQERVNAVARQQGWNLELTWSGFREVGSDTPLTAFDPAIEPTLRTTLRGLLRRFVNSAWINERC